MDKSLAKWFAPKSLCAAAAAPAGHPFRASLPAHVLPRRRGAVAAVRKPKAPLRITNQDVRDFLLAYCACFLAVSAFIA